MCALSYCMNCKIKTKELVWLRTPTYDFSDTTHIILQIAPISHVKPFAPAVTSIHKVSEALRTLEPVLLQQIRVSQHNV